MPASNCWRKKCIYLAFTAAVVSRNAWYDFTASGSDMVLNQSKFFFYFVTGASGVHKKGGALRVAKAA